MLFKFTITTTETEYMEAKDGEEANAIANGIYQFRRSTRRSLSGNLRVEVEPAHEAKVVPRETR